MSAPSLVIPLSPATRKSRITKRSSKSYSSEEWKRHRPLITHMYFEQGKNAERSARGDWKRVLFLPTARMYKSRLHSWGLDKKKKEHEMLDLVREGLTQGANDGDKVFVVRGREITLTDASYYFRRKGIKDPTTLLESDIQLPNNSESADEAKAEAQTPPSTSVETKNLFEASKGEYCDTNFVAQHPMPLIPDMKPTSDFTIHQIRIGRRHLAVQVLKLLPRFRTLPIETFRQYQQPSPDQQRYLDDVFTQMKEHYRRVFASRQLTVDTSKWNTTPDDALADKFDYSMYQGYNLLWSGRINTGFQHFYHAFDMVEQSLRDNHVRFLIYVMDLMIRYGEIGYQEPLILLLLHVADMAESVDASEDNPVFLLSSGLKTVKISRSWLAEATLEKLLHFFEDSIGYFHPETIALLQVYTFSLIDRKRYDEAALRIHQLVDAFEMTQGGDSWEACDAFRCKST